MIKAGRPIRSAGLSILEILISLVILTLATAMASGVVTNQLAAEASFEHERNGLEVAHRVILQYIDNPNAFEGSPNRVNLADHTYRFEVTHSLLRVTPLTDFGALIEETVYTDVNVSNLREANAEQVFREKLHRVHVDVYLDDPDLPENPAGPVASLTREYNPFVDDDRAFQYTLELLEEQLDQMSRDP